MVVGVGQVFEVLRRGHLIGRLLGARALQRECRCERGERLGHANLALLKGLGDVALVAAAREGPLAKADGGACVGAVEPAALQCEVGGRGVAADAEVVVVGGALRGKGLVGHEHRSGAVYRHHHFRAAVVEVAHCYLRLALTRVAGRVGAHLQAVLGLREAVVGDHGVGLVELALAVHDLRAAVLAAEHEYAPRPNLYVAAVGHSELDFAVGVVCLFVEVDHAAIQRAVFAVHVGHLRLDFDHAGAGVICALYGALAANQVVDGH